MQQAKDDAIVDGFNAGFDWCMGGWPASALYDKFLTLCVDPAHRSDVANSLNAFTIMKNIMSNSSYVEVKVQIPTTYYTVVDGVKFYKGTPNGIGYKNYAGNWILPS